MRESVDVQNGTTVVKDGTIDISIKGKWISVPALNVEGKDIVVRGKWLKMALVEAEEWLETDVQDPEFCVSMLRKRSSGPLRADIFTFAQKLPATEPRFKYYMERDSVAVADTTTFQGWWDHLPQESRKNVRRAQKRGVEVRVKELDDELIRGLMDLNNDSPVRQGKPYTHFGKNFEQVKKDQESFPDRRDLICAYAGDELIGFAKIIYRNDIASILQILPKASQNDKRPANAMMAKLVELCEQKKISSLTFGKFHYGNKRGDRLQEFKIRNGFEEVLVPRYYIPLTLKGKICMKLKLHRGLIGIFPHWVIMFGNAVRARLYRLRCSINWSKSIPAGIES
jgi:hypothetical protein